MQVITALDRGAQLFDGPLGHQPEMAAKIKRERRSVLEALNEVQSCRGEAASSEREYRHVLRLREAVEDAHALVQEMRGSAGSSA